MVPVPLRLPRKQARRAVESSPACGFVPQSRLVNLAGRRQRQHPARHELARHFVVGQMPVAPLANLARLQRAAGLGHHVQPAHLAHHRVGHADASDHHHLGVAIHQGLDFSRVDVETALDVPVFFAAFDGDQAARVHRAQVAWFAGSRPLKTPIRPPHRCSLAPRPRPRP